MPDVDHGNALPLPGQISFTIQSSVAATSITVNASSVIGEAFADGPKGAFAPTIAYKSKSLADFDTAASPIIKNFQAEFLPAGTALQGVLNTVGGLVSIARRDGVDHVLVAAGHRNTNQRLVERVRDLDVAVVQVMHRPRLSAIRLYLAQGFVPFPESSGELKSWQQVLSLLGRDDLVAKLKVCVEPQDGS